MAVTRPEERADGLAGLLAELGFEPVHCPLIRIAPPEDPEPLDVAALQLVSQSRRWDLILFTSAGAVEALGEALGRRGRSVLPRGPAVAAIGTATAQAVTALGREPDLVPQEFVAEAFLEELVERYGTPGAGRERKQGDLPGGGAGGPAPGELLGFRVLFPRAEQARDVLPDGLRARGAEVDVVEAYRTLPDRNAGRELAQQVSRGEVDVVTFTSGSTVRAFVEGAGRGWKVPPGFAAAAIGPVTAEAARRAGLPVQVVAVEHTAKGLARAVAQWAEK